MAGCSAALVSSPQPGTGGSRSLQERTHRVRHQLRSAFVITASALMLGSGAGTAAAQGPLQFELPFPLTIPGLSSLAADAGLAPADAAPAGIPSPADLAPAELRKMAFEGSVVAAVNDARFAVGAGRLVTDPALEASARERAAELASGNSTTGEVTVPEDAVPESSADTDRTTLALPAGSTPQNAVATLIGDTGMRERMLDGEFTKVGVGVATAEDGTVHVVQEFSRG